MLFRFENFQLDQARAELRGPDGVPIKLRRKAFDMLALLAANAGRILSKQQLTAAIWPNVHVGEDSLFQCIREIRTALGDEQHRMLKVVPGRGYLLDVEVANGAADAPKPTQPANAAPAPRRFVLSRPAVFGAAAGVIALVGVAIAAPILAPDLFKRTPPTIAIMPIAIMGNDEELAAMAAAVTTQLTDGLARIETIRVLTPQSSHAAATYLFKGELQKTDDTWRLQTRIVTNGTDAVQPVAAVSVNLNETDLQVQRSRLAAGVGHQLAQRFNAMLHGVQQNGDASRATAGKVAIAQAIASINRTTRERFTDAQTMLEKALADEPDNIEVEIALAALKLRGVQMVWYGPQESIAAETSARVLLEHALRARPNSLAALGPYCRLLVATNQFIDGLVACARTLSLNPWDGMALYHIGLAQFQLGRFEDALETFKQADRYDTPEVSRWTWLLGAGIACLLLDRPDEAISWLQRSIAITPASGRTHMLLATANQMLGRSDEAKTAMATGLALRPGTTAGNFSLPKKNTSPVYRTASDRLMQATIEAGLPER
jgi:DNA-binding winged helix-turn-helix (wHTH) protein/tetratricopeptide (TPR) repeat protein